MSHFKVAQNLWDNYKDKMAYEANPQTIKKKYLPHYSPAI